MTPSSPSNPDEIFLCFKKTLPPLSPSCLYQSKQRCKSLFAKYLSTPHQDKCPRFVEAHRGLTSLVPAFSLVQNFPLLFLSFYYFFSLSPFCLNITAFLPPSKIFFLSPLFFPPTRNLVYKWMFWLLPVRSFLQRFFLVAPSTLKSPQNSNG